jgi:hypothetical protein
VSRHRITRPLLSFASFAVLVAVAGCNLPDAATPEMLGASAKASIALDAQFVFAAANAINVRVTYSTTGSPKTMIDSTVSIHRTSTGTLNWEGPRGFPVEIDLAPCLLDPLHVSPVSGPSCSIGIVIRMLENGTEIDRVTILPFTVEPGKLNVVPQIIVLREIGSIDIGTPVQLLRVGESVNLTARLSDVAGNPVTGREITWRSSDAVVARVNADGSVQGLAPGQATFTARVGTREGSVTLTVSPK